MMVIARIQIAGFSFSDKSQDYPANALPQGNFAFKFSEMKPFHPVQPRGDAR
jgi:hypothetical protein